MRLGIRSGFMFLAVLCTTAYASAVDLVFNAFPQPCRVIDTRIGGGPLASGSSRSFKIAGTADFPAQGGTAGGCGVPTTAGAVSMNVVAVSPQGAGNLRAAAYPNGFAPTGSIINYQALTPNLNIANALDFPICDRDAAPSCGYDITFQPNGAGVHIVVDVLGYFSPDHKHSGDDITTGTVSEARIDASVARDNEIMPVVLGNDGPGSGLNADFLDGMDAASFDALYEKKYARTVIVRSGRTPNQNGIALLDALDSISTASATDPYLLKLEPGIYDLGLGVLSMKQYVDMEGSGESTTRIKNGSSVATVVGANNTEVRFLTIENYGGNVEATAFSAFSVSPRLFRVTLIASGSVGSPSGVGNNGFSGFDSLATLKNVTAIVTGSTSANRAIKFINYGVSQAPILDSIIATATGAQSNHGIYTEGGPMTIHNVRASVSGGNFGVAVYLFGGTHQLDSVFASSLASGTPYGIIVGGGSSTMTNVHAVATGGFLAIGLSVQYGSATLSGVTVSASGGTNLVDRGLDVNGDVPGSTVEVNNSKLKAPTGNDVTLDGTTNIYISASQMQGGDVFVFGGSTGSVKCAGVTDEDYNFFGSVCP